MQAILDPVPALWPEELGQILRAVPMRRREFASGRAAARAALAEIGVPAAAIPAGRDRAPVWPHGICGAISHTRQIAAAIVARRDDLGALGLDLEPATPMPDDLARHVAASGDAPEGAGLPMALAAKLLFSAKEAAFKAQFPLTGLWLDYRDVAMTLTARGFLLRVRGIPLAGRWTLDDGLFICCIAVLPEVARRLTLAARQHR